QLIGVLAIVEANRGNSKQSEEALAFVARTQPYIDANAPRGFETETQALAVPAWRASVLLAAGDYRHGVEAGNAVLAKLEQLQAEAGSQRWVKDLWRRVTNFPVLRSEYALSDYAAAERGMRQVLAVRERQPFSDTMDRREMAFERAFTALVLARLDRQGDA